MSTRSLIFFAIAAVVVVGVNATVYQVQETEKAIKLKFGNIVDSDVRPGLRFKMPIAEAVKKFDARVLTVDAVSYTHLTLPTI